MKFMGNVKIVNHYFFGFFQAQRLGRKLILAGIHFRYGSLPVF